MTDLIALKAANVSRWASVVLTRNFTPVARALVAAEARQRYQAVSAETGVPWCFVAVAHEREASQNWKTQLGQGDPLDRVSVHDPAGRGPFRSWEEGAIDALANCHPYAARNKDWTIGGTLTMLEQYNGLGYASRGVPSPYLWSGTDQYKSGKYVRDGVFDPNAVDQQLGCAGLLTAMMALDPTITFTGTTISAPSLRPARKPPPVPKSPSVSNPSNGSIGAAVASVLSAILSAFKRKWP